MNGVCDLRTKEALRRELRRFLREAGDNIPEEDILKGTNEEHIDTWSFVCSDEDPSRVVSAARFEKNDWYSCIIKNLATDPSFRNRGLGTDMAREAKRRAIDEAGCKVLLADITVGNEPSEKIFEKKLGFMVVDEFCWASGERPAKIRHLVLKPPVDGRCL